MLVPKLTDAEEPALLERPGHCLLSHAVHRSDGRGPTVDLGLDHAPLLVVSMCINHVTENERLLVSIWGSADGDNWGDRPLALFPPKSYCGIYSMFLNLAAHPHVRYLRASWNMIRRSGASQELFFGFSISARESSPQPA